MLIILDFWCKPTMRNVRSYNSKAQNLTQKSHTQFMVDILSKFKTSLRFQSRLTWSISNSSAVNSVTTPTTSVIFFPLSKGDSFLTFLLTYNHFHFLTQSALEAASDGFLVPTSVQTENPWSIKVNSQLGWGTAFSEKIHDFWEWLFQYPAHVNN